MSNLRSMSVANFKKLVGADKIQIIVSPTTQKLFASGDNGQNYKAEQNLDVLKPIVVLMDGDDLDTACFINERNTAKVKITL